MDFMDTPMRKLWFACTVGLLLGCGLNYNILAQGSLSNQVLQLLPRTNVWTGKQTFQNMRIAPAAIPSDTVNRIYGDVSGNLYYNGGLIAGAGGGVTPHNLLSTTHPDTVAASPVRGDVAIANLTPAWTKLALCTSGFYVGSNGTDTVCASSAAAFTAIPAAQITGTASAFVGTAITALNATNLTSGTIPTARLTGVITNTEVNAAAAIAYSKLALTTSVVNADIAAGAAIAYSKLNLLGSVVTGDLTAGTLLFDRWASNGCTNLQVAQFNGAAWVCKTLVTSDVSGAGTVSSVALALPAIFTVSGSPVTGSGTLTATLATETANTIWAGPTTGAATAPTFRSLVVADLPVITSAQVNNTIALTGVDINTASQVTATHLAAALPFAQGGTNLTVAANNTTLISNGAAWAAKVIPDCVGANTALQYTQATSTFSCGSPAASHALLSTTHTDTLADTVVRGDVIIGNSTPKWSRLAKGPAGQILTTTATDATWSSTMAYPSLVASTPFTETQTWNAASTFAAWVINITNTLSNADSKFQDYQIAGTSKMYVRADGSITQGGVTFANLPTVNLTNGTLIYCSDCTIANPCAAAGTGSFAKRLNGVWVCN